MTYWTRAYWQWRIAFEWRTRIERPLARYFNRKSQERGKA